MSLAPLLLRLGLIGMALCASALRGAEKASGQTLPIRGFCIPTPSPARLEEFIKFIQEELAPRSVNTLILRVDYNFQFQSRPELADPGGLSREHAKKIAQVCKAHPAVDLIPKDVVICDWHYERADQTAVYFAMKGLDVVTCCWRNPEVAAAQARDMLRFRAASTPQMEKHFLGMVQTVWSGAGGFLDQYYGRKPPRDQKKPEHTETKCFVRLFEELAVSK